VKRLARKPFPALTLLPTPGQSEDENIVDDTEVWETTAFDHEDDDAVPQSSPIKRQPRTSISSLGKRQRASSPMVIVPIKCIRTTPPDMLVEYYPLLPEEKAAEDGSRRLRRSKNEIKALTSRLRTQRSRTSLDSGLRTQSRKMYVEQFEVEDETSEDTNSGSESASSAAMSSDSSTSSRRTRRHTRHIDSRQSQDVPQYDGAYDDHDNDADECDDLGITPARPMYKWRSSSKACKGPRVHQPLAKQLRPGRKEWWKIRGGVIDDSEDDGSEDELSFH
jgi:hypothetical protein